MAKGQYRTFNESLLNIGTPVFNLSNTNDFKAMLITTLPVITQTTPDTSDFTEVSGDGYTAGGIALTNSWSESSGTTTLDFSTDPAWSQNPTGPDDIVAALIYSTNASATGQNALGFVDLTKDAGTTPISLQDGNISFTWPVAGAFNISRP